MRELVEPSKPDRRPSGPPPPPPPRPWLTNQVGPTLTNGFTLDPASGAFIPMPTPAAAAVKTLRQQVMELQQRLMAVEAELAMLRQIAHRHAP